MSRPSKLYLVCYNSLQSLGWFIALLRLLPCLAPPFPVHSAYAVAGDLICFLQACAILETVHAAIGLVPTAPLLAFLQWGGRTHFILAVVGQIPEVQRSPSVFITLIAWSISEVIRYSHYALTTLKVCPEWLTYLRFRRVHYATRLKLASDKYNAQFTASQISCQLKKMHSCQENRLMGASFRYTAFIPLYPIGVGPGEMWTMYQALPFVKKRNLYSGFFKKFSMSYHSFLVGLLVLYPFMWLKLYLHVFKQRKSKLGKGSRKKRA